MDSDDAGNARAKVESKLARVQNALAVVEEARRKAEDEASCLANERVSLLLELKTCKDEMSVIQKKALKEKKALEEAYKKGLDVIFNYGYGYCAFAHNICGSQPEVRDGMSDMSKTLSLEFFINHQCPLGAVPTEGASMDVSPGEVTNAPEREAPVAIVEMDHSKVGKHFSAA